METLRDIWHRCKAINSANPDLIYTLLAIGLTIGAVATIPDGTADGKFKAPGGLATALVVVETAVVAFVRRWPVAVFAVLVGALIAETALDYQPGDAAFLGALIVVFTVAARTVGIQMLAGMTLNSAVLIVLFFLEGGELDTVGELLINFGIFGVVWAAGMIVRSRITQVQQAETYAAELSLQRDVAAQEAAEQERARIARELHDAVGHTLNLIVVQAGAAQRVREANPAAAYEALKSIENTGRQALGDMDRMLGILRDGDRGSDGSTLGPRPGLARLNTMLDEARSTGLDVTVETTGEQQRLPVSIDLTAYRIIQEAITNVMKHAPGATARVAIQYAPRSLNIEVSNGPGHNGAVRSSTGGGRGLPGMQERVALFGGTLETMPVNGGGFVVRVSLPIGEGA